MVAMTRFSSKMEAPIAEMIKYKKGALRSRRGLYAILSTMIATRSVPKEASKKATANGSFRSVRPKNPKYAPSMITPPCAKFEKFMME